MKEIKTIVGERLRARRQVLGFTVAALAKSSGLSARYIISAEKGQANLSLTKLDQLSRALSVSMTALVSVGVRGDIDALLAHRSDTELRHILNDLRSRYGDDRTRSLIALLGVRGAGKSSVGKALAAELGHTFVELDAHIEKVADLSLAEIFSLHGEDFYREMEREALEEIIQADAPMVVATGGGIVTDSLNYGRLKDHACTVWLSATPEDHWNRVIDQGDRRPMRDHPQAMAQLRNLLAVRGPLYSQADFRVDTHGLSIESIVHQIEEFLGAVTHVG